jgi:hypothetical protein
MPLPPLSSVVTPSNKKSVTRHNTADQTVRLLRALNLRSKQILQVNSQRLGICNILRSIALGIPAFDEPSGKKTLSNGSFRHQHHQARLL